MGGIARPRSRNNTRQPMLVGRGVGCRLSFTCEPCMILWYTTATVSMHVTRGRKCWLHVAMLGGYVSSSVAVTVSWACECESQSVRDWESCSRQNHRRGATPQTYHSDQSISLSFGSLCIDRHATLCYWTRNIMNINRFFCWWCEVPADRRLTLLDFHWFTLHVRSADSAT